MSTLQPFTGKWNKTLAAHLLNRATFGPRPDEIGHAASAGLDKTVDSLLDFESRTEEQLPPVFPTTSQADKETVEAIRGWWIRRMIETSHPLQEKLTLFWHGHFATSANEVMSAEHMFIQNEFLRANAAGNFRDLLLGISRDPAMLKYLDNGTSRKEHPNENYARELMELFSMGIGNYSEDDVKAAARAFTGWTYEGDTFVFHRSEHDTGTKTFLGHTGDLDGTDIINIILQQPCTAHFMSAKLLKYFVTDKPDPSAVEEVATLLRESQYEFAPVLRAIFTSEYFYTPGVYRTQIKSPTQLVVGATRALGLSPSEPTLAATMRSLGQDLFAPPNVKGWDGGEAWINTTTLLLRYNFAGDLIGRLPPETRHSRGKATRGLNGMYYPDVAASAPALVDALTGRLLQAKLESKARQWLIEQAETTRVSERTMLVAHLIMSMPDYQLC